MVGKMEDREAWLKSLPISIQFNVPSAKSIQPSLSEAHNATLSVLSMQPG